MNPEESLADIAVEALKAGADLERAVYATAKLLEDCYCQEHRKAESLAALSLADAATARWRAAMRQFARIAHLRSTN